MGPSYDLYCLDCEEEAQVSAGHDPIREYELLPLLALAKVLTPEVASAINACGQISEDQYSVRAPVAWLGQHGRHRLRVRSEYGEVNGQCSRRVVCAHCGCEPGYCDLDVDHGGGCSTKRQRELSATPEVPPAVAVVRSEAAPWVGAHRAGGKESSGDA